MSKQLVWPARKETEVLDVQTIEAPNTEPFRTPQICFINYL